VRPEVAAFFLFSVCVVILLASSSAQHLPAFSSSTSFTSSAGLSFFCFLLWPGPAFIFFCVAGSLVLLLLFFFVVMLLSSFLAFAGVVCCPSCTGTP
jgi:hypothetical protein